MREAFIFVLYICNRCWRPSNPLIYYSKCRGCTVWIPATTHHRHPASLLRCSLPLRGDAFGAKQQHASSSSRTVWHPLTPAPPSSAHMKKEFYFFNVINHSYFHLNQLFSFIEVNDTVLALYLLRRTIICTRINILL